jgi:hypothetical protein
MYPRVTSVLIWLFYQYSLGLAGLGLFSLTLPTDHPWFDCRDWAPDIPYSYTSKTMHEGCDTQNFPLGIGLSGLLAPERSIPSGKFSIQGSKYWWCDGRHACFSGIAVENVWSSIICMGVPSNDALPWTAWISTGSWRIADTRNYGNGLECRQWHPRCGWSGATVPQALRVDFLKFP